MLNPNFHSAGSPSVDPHIGENDVAEFEGSATHPEGTQEGRFDVAEPENDCNTQPPDGGAESPVFRHVMATYVDPPQKPARAARSRRARPQHDPETDQAFHNLLRRDLVPGEVHARPDEGGSPPGHPPILNELAKAQVIALLSVGFTRIQAADYIGCHRSTLWRSAKRDPEFERQLTRAAAAAELNPLLSIVRASHDSWRAAAWLLNHIRSKSPRKRKVPKDARADPSTSEQEDGQ